ncbi:hypothetical protein [Agrobacterium sp. ICMP 6402]|uniref:hypothetical protein n=1 Tax=Agrobacterium sp. ICMP 6402 TaxID=2292443 RepID=UPI001AED54EF|nr:hypothetical protein [Agrobacterium sp. ICMP 6402]
MYLAVPPQPDCQTAWREAVRLVDANPGHEAHNVIIDVVNPVAGADRANPKIAVVNTFLEKHEKAVEAVANTIFPQSLYYSFGAPKFFKVFDEKVLSKVRKNDRWSGYYFERMTHLPGGSDNLPNPLWDIVRRIRDPDVTALNKFELTIFDPLRDIDDSPYGGQCLSFLSFKLAQSGNRKKLNLTVMYRNHYYIEKLLGNLIGLGRLMDFVAREGEVELGSLTVISTHAVIDQPGKTTKRPDIEKLLADFDSA